MIGIFKASIKRNNIRYARFAVMYIILAAGAAAASVISIQATGNMTQAAEFGVTGEMMGFLAVLAVAGVVSVVSEAVMELLRQRSFGAVIYKIRKEFTRRLLGMPYKDFAAKNSGEGASLFTNDVPQAADFISAQALTQISRIAVLVVTVVFMAYINWWLTLIYFALFPPLALLQAKLSAPMGAKAIEMSEKKAEFNSVVTDALQNPLTVKAYALEASVECRFDGSYMEYVAVYRSFIKTHAGLALVGIFATFMPTFMLFMIAGALAINGSMTVAGFIMLTIISFPVGGWLMMFAQDMARLRQFSASSLRVLEFTPDTPEWELHMEIGGNHAAEFDRVSFGYSEEDSVLADVSFTIEKGGITAIAGESGCGKSTALKLMLGLYKPNGGRISLSSASITYVPQDCCLLPVSISENILGGLPLDEKRLREACENAGIYDFIQGLPDGFDSVLAESAANVSGGQKQRIAMARAFYRDADILLLDEATSALDPVTEQAVLEAFRRYIKDGGKTAVVVAHRQTVLDMSDRVITLAKGDAAV
jgi:ABC-type bacteriocin/lantibiotic exporter with double-glycine peptidase domain